VPDRIMREIWDMLAEVGEISERMAEEMKRRAG
jgi:hypothetical protein